ncbi:hypothetical protein IFM89_018047 [Coptis chinensis]|uniref:RRM domain-containing protein n=1 Tax=Coptis chinensis TaxID=261450 RepID=A0A835HVV9_9MAGN|nr:hypothetical protein IFM89_018047 [Coptis chinensis]
MALSRFYISGATLHFHTRAFLIPARSFSSSKKGVETTSEQSGEASNFYVTKYSEVFPKATRVFTKLKDKFLSPWSGNTVISESLNSRKDATNVNGSEVTKKSERVDAVLGELKSRLQQPSERTRDSYSHTEDIATCPTSEITSDKTSGDSMRTEDSLSSTELAERKEISSSCNSIQIATSNPHNRNSLTTESSDVTIDSTTCDGKSIDEMFDELGELKGRLEPLERMAETDIATYSTSTVRRSSGDLCKVTSNNPKLVEQKYGYQQYELDQAAVLCPSGDQEEAANSLLLGSISEGGKAGRALEVAISSEEASGECEEIPPNEKLVTQFPFTEERELFSTSSSSKKVSKFADQLVEMKMDSKEADDETMMLKTSLGHSKVTSRDDSMENRDVKTLIHAVKDLPKSASQSSSSNVVIFEKIDFLNNGCPPRHGSQAAVTDEQTVAGKLKNLSQQKRQKKVPKERSFSFIVTNERDNGTLTKLDDKVSCDGTKLHNSDYDMAKKVPVETVDSQILKDCEKGSNSDYASFDYSRSRRPSPQDSLPPQKDSLRRDPNTLLFTEKGREQKVLLVRFLRTSQSEADIKSAFGPIDDIYFISSCSDVYKDAYVRFKTKEGMRKALTNSSTVVGKYDVILEPVSPSTYTSNRLIRPNLIGVCGIPPSFVKNPTRTVMVKGLPHNVSSHHLEETFSFSGARITAFFMGSSSSVAYIEFETEEAKEKAIAACSIPISGSKLSVFRIDAPVTTIVRISNVAHGENSQNTIRKVCKSYGKFKRLIRRSPGIYDVYYQETEWPNMVDILNSLNGQVVSGHQWIAQPVTLIPIEILKFLWSQPDGKRDVYSVIQNLCQKVEEKPSGMSKVQDLAAQYYEEA